jgi:hypothetical protein
MVALFGEEGIDLGAYHIIMRALFMAETAEGGEADKLREALEKRRLRLTDDNKHN